MPGLSKLYCRDFTIRPAIIAFAFGLLVAAVIGWGAPTSSPDPSVDLSFEIEMSKRVPPVALAFSALAALVVWWRYRTVKQILMEGAIVTGVVQQLHRHGTRTNNEEYATVRPVYSYSYWVTVLYTIGGGEQKVRLKLPHSGFTYGLTEGGEVELSVLESKPRKPLIRIVYLGRW